MRTFGWALVGLFMNLALGQPATVTLKAKIRDFKEYAATDPTTHPDFENDIFMGCGGENLGYVKNTLGLNGLPDTDTALFRGDNREPVLQALTNQYSNTPCFTSLEKFNDWYNDNPAFNRRFLLDLVLTRDNQGLYTFNDDQFFPLDVGGGYQKFLPTDPEPFGKLVPTHLDHVYGFTMELHSIFTYTAGKGQNFSFKGDDDVWVFINGQLAIDLGGLHHEWSANVNLDDKASVLGLKDGGSYTLDFFFAERHSTDSHCQITTSLQLSQKEPLPKIVANPPGQEFEHTLQVGLTLPNIPGAVIHYTIDGSEPTETSPIYTNVLTLDKTTTVKAKAFLGDFLPSPTLTEVYTWKPSLLPTPIANPPGQAFEHTLQVGFTLASNPDAQLRYTVDGSEPTESSPLFTGPLTLDATTTVKVKAFLNKWVPSPTLTEVYTWMPSLLPKPVANPPGKSFMDSLWISISVPGHPKAEIHYTVDGSAPNEISPLYTGPILTSRTMVLKAIASEPLWLPSEVMTEEYVFTLPPNAISIRMEKPVSHTTGNTLILANPHLQRPIALVSVDGGVPTCLSCPPGTESLVLNPMQFPEWVTLSRDPFQYQFRIYDNLGHFVVKQSGDVTQAMLDLAPVSDKKGYRILRFRWIPVAEDGRAVGTGAYILHANVISRSTTIPVVVTKSDLFKRFGFVRED